MEKNISYKDHRDYVLIELSKINTEYSKLAIDKFYRINEENTKELHHLIFSVNEVEKTNIAWYWEWYRYIKN
jgi:hypothetical protein